MKRLAQIVFLFAAMGIILVGCSGTGGSDTTAAWVAVFQDNFDRADTVGMNLGANWSIIGTPGTDEMYITSGQVHSSFQDASGPGVIAVYTGTVDYSKPLRVSVRAMITTGGAASPYEFLGIEINADGTTYAGYYASLTFDGSKLWLKLARTHGTNDVNPPAPALSDITASAASGAWYALEMETSGTTITARIKDTAGTTLGTVTITDSTAAPLSGGSVVFYNYIVDDTGAPMPGYSAEFDDFKLESCR
jgi:hypothetical protein